jgi:hypothetical protein
MARSLDRLLSLAGAALGGPTAPTTPTAEGVDRARGADALWGGRNGFYALSSALLVRPLGGDVTGVRSIATWNEPTLWRSAYDDLAADGWCFAEDAFGGQFSLHDDGVFAFDPETGARDRLADDLVGWAEALLDDAEVLTGYPLAHEWQVRHGPLPVGQRLVPTVPFVLGGSFDVDNLHALDEVQGMRLRGELAVQLRDLPDGATVRYGVAE